MPSPRVGVVRQAAPDLFPTRQRHAVQRHHRRHAAILERHLALLDMHLVQRQRHTAGLTIGLAILVLMPVAWVLAALFLAALALAPIAWVLASQSLLLVALSLGLMCVHQVFLHLDLEGLNAAFCARF